MNNPAASCEKFSRLKNPKGKERLKGHFAPESKVHEQFHRTRPWQAQHLIQPVRGFESMKTAYATINGLEPMCMRCEGQFRTWTGHPKKSKERLMGRSAISITSSIALVR